MIGKYIWSSRKKNPIGNHRNQTCLILKNEINQEPGGHMWMCDAMLKKKNKNCTDNLPWYSSFTELREFHVFCTMSQISCRICRGISPCKRCAIFWNGYKKNQIQDNDAFNVVSKDICSEVKGYSFSVIQRQRAGLRAQMLMFQKQPSLVYTRKT